ncbi:MAG: twin-arginine translocation signal domain-containing protein, partial [Verrucomicrobia bacterium]|nr:twin-arginine translocation signal domain-containing protein [Verrucomicrobiota bacterium]
MNIISRRSFLERSALLGTGLGLAGMTHLPLVMRR